MTIKEEIQLVEMLIKDLKASVLAFDEQAKALQKKGMHYKPMIGDGSSVTDPFAGLKQGETSFAIERKIITVREYLNDLRKRIVYYNGKRES